MTRFLAVAFLCGVISASGAEIVAPSAVQSCSGLVRVSARDAGDNYKLRVLNPPSIDVEKAASGGIVFAAPAKEGEVLIVLAYIGDDGAPDFELKVIDVKSTLPPPPLAEFIPQGHSVFASKFANNFRVAAGEIRSGSLTTVIASERYLTQLNTAVIGGDDPTLRAKFLPFFSEVKSRILKKHPNGMTVTQFAEWLESAADDLQFSRIR